VSLRTNVFENGSRKGASKSRNLTTVNLFEAVMERLKQGRIVDSEYARIDTFSEILLESDDDPPLENPGQVASNATSTYNQLHLGALEDVCLFGELELVGKATGIRHQALAVFECKPLFANAAPLHFTDQFRKRSLEDLRG
jgi:hypothetical protein